MAKTPKSDPTVVYQKRDRTAPIQYCKNCASLLKPVRCSQVYGFIYRRGSCLLWTQAPNTGP